MRNATLTHRHVALSAGTERAFSGRTADGLGWDHKGKGVYVDAISGLPLFTSDTKFNRCARGFASQIAQCCHCRACRRACCR